MLTYLDLQNRVLRWIDEGENTDITQAIVKDALSAANRRLSLSRTWPWLLWPKEEALTTVQNVRTYSLNPACAKLVYLFDTIQRTFTPLIPRTAWENLAVDRTTQNIKPMGFDYGPVWPCAAQPSAASTVTIVSSLSDTSGSVQFIGLDANDQPYTETLTVNGTTPVTSTGSFSQLLRITKNGTWSGTLTVTDASANVLLTLGATEPARQYPTIEFTENPIGGLTYVYRFSRAPDPLTNDADIPNLWPNDCAEILVYDALFDLTTYNTELGIKEQNAWGARRLELYNQLTDAADKALMGAYPRMVRDLSGDSKRVQMF